MRIIEKAQLMSASEVDRTLQRLAHEIVEKSGGTKHLALIGIRRRGVPLAQRIAQAMRGIDGVEIPAMNGLFDLGRPKRVSLCVLIDRGHREMPIEAQYIGRTVQTSDTEIIEVRLREIDQEERVVLVDRVE